MKAKNFLSIFLLLLNLTMLGQDFRWAFGFMGYSTTVGKKVTQDVYGDMIIMGDYAASTIDCDPSAGVHTLTMNSSYGNDIYLGKYDINGNLIWAIDLGGPYTDDSQGLATDSDGNIYVAGSFIGSILFTPAFDSNAYFYGSQYNDPKGFIVKYDKNGNYKWAVPFVGNIAQVTCFGVTVDEFKNVYVTGQMRGTVDFDPSSDTMELTTAGLTDIFVAKYDSTGTLGWAFNIGSYEGYYLEGGRDIVYKGGFLYVVGGFSGTNTDFNPNPGLSNHLTAEGATDPFLAKYDLLGNCIWAVGITGTVYPEFTHAVDVDNNGNAYITGEYWNYADFDPSSDTAVVTSYGGQDIFAAKYDAFGNYKWAFTAGSNSGNDEIGYDIDINNVGDMYVTGSHYGLSGYSDFDPSSDYNSHTGSSGSYSKIFVARFDTAMNYKWAMNIGAGGYSPYDSETGHGIFARDDGKIFITGLSRSSADFDPSDDNFNLPNSSNLYASVASYDGNVYSEIGIGEHEVSSETFSLFPNPASDYFTVQTQNNENIKSIQIIDVMGKTVRLIDKCAGRDIKIERNSLVPGLYFVSLITNAGDRKTAKLVIK